MTDPTEEDSEKEVVSADWLERLKAAPAAAVERAKKFCTSGKLKEVAYESLDGVTTLLDAVGPFLPPPGNTAASLLSGLCKCVHGAHVNNTNLEMLRDRCLDLLDLVLQLGHTDAFISTSRDSSKPPKLFKGFTRIMNRFQTFLKEANAYCENYTKAGILAGLSRFFFHAGHKEDYEELITELRDLRDDATFTLGVYLKELLEEVVYKLNAGMPSVGGANERIQASLEKIQARLAEDIPFKMDEKLEEYMARQNVRGYSILLHQPHLKALWSKHFMHKQAVRWGMWWTVFPGELALDDTLNEAAKQQLVDLLINKDSKDAFRRAVELEDTIYISIDELCLSFPDDSPLLPTVQALLCKGIDLMCEDKDRTELAIAEAGRGQKKLEEKLTAMEAELKKEMSYSNFSQHIHQNNMQKLWSVYFKHEQAVRWGLWWAVFPAKLEGLPATSKQELVDLLASPEAQAAFKRAVEVEDSIFLSIDELRRSFPADQPLLERVKTLLQSAPPPPPRPSGQKPLRVGASRAVSPARLQRGPRVAPVPPQRPQSARQLPFGRSKVVHEVHEVAGPTRVPSEPVLGQRAPLAPHQRQPAYASDAHFPAPLRTHSFQGYGAAPVPDQAWGVLVRRSLPTLEAPGQAWIGAHGIPVSNSQLEVGGEASRATQAQARGRRPSGMGLSRALSQPVPGQLHPGLSSPQHSAPVLDYQLQPEASEAAEAAKALSAVTRAATAAAAAAAVAAKNADFLPPAKVEARQAWASLTAAAGSPAANSASVQQAEGPGLLRPVSGKGSHCQLPQVNTENWGREQQIQELGELLANSYGVLLLHGPPGIGKTCLAVDVGWYMWEKGCLPGGAVLVPLKGAASARKQQQRLSEALGVHHVNDALDRIRSAGRMLLILDAAETCLLGAEVGAFVALLNTVMACHPDLVVLVTSAVPWPTSLPRLGAFMERRVLPLDDMAITALVNARCGPGVLSAAQVKLVVAACRGSPLLARKCADACASGRATWMECVEYAQRQRRRQDAEAAAEPLAGARHGTQPMWRFSAY